MLDDHSLTTWCLFERPDAADPPNCLLNAHKLTSIRLSGNYYSAVPTYLSSVTALQSLHIANNAIGSGCTACLSHLTALTKLVMQQCNLNAVPQSLAPLSRLKWLCLSRNRLESVPEDLPWQHLELLHLRGNELKCVPCVALSKAVRLETVDCGDNLPLQVRGLLCPKSSCHSCLSSSCALTEAHFACCSLCCMHCDHAYKRQRMEVLMAACSGVTTAVHFMSFRLHLHSKVYFVWMQCMLYSRLADHKQSVLITLSTAQQCPVAQCCDVHIGQIFSLICHVCGRWTSTL